MLSLDLLLCPASSLPRTGSSPNPRLSVLEVKTLDLVADILVRDDLDVATRNGHTSAPVDAGVGCRLG